jgi:molybdopterin synthase catalytic subunit
MNAIEVAIHDGPLPAKCLDCVTDSAGALLTFEGRVRPFEEGRPIRALDYEVYEPMATRLLEEYAAEELHCHKLVGIAIEHSRGRVPVAAISFRMQVSAPHRQPALAAMAHFIDCMKRDVPIWKQPVYLRMIAAILAGGRARRLEGMTKGLLPTANGTILDRLLQQFAAAGIDDAVIVANDSTPYAALGRPILSDLRLPVGPLGGIEAALQHAGSTYDAVVTMPCDLPNITADEIRGLVAAYAGNPGRVVMAATADGDHPLCAVVPPQVLGHVVAAIQREEFSVVQLWRALNAVRVTITDASRLRNINTPDDLAQWQERRTIATDS